MNVDVELDKRCVVSELLGQAWMKPDKGNRAPHVLLVSKRFNEVACLPSLAYM